MLARKKPFTRPEPLVPKPQTRSLEDRGPARNAAWLTHIRSLPCLICFNGRQQHPTRAHHPKGLFPRTMGRRVSDLFCLPLCFALSLLFLPEEPLYNSQEKGG